MQRRHAYIIRYHSRSPHRDGPQSLFVSGMFWTFGYAFDSAVLICSFAPPSGLSREASHHATKARIPFVSAFEGVGTACHASYLLDRSSEPLLSSEPVAQHVVKLSGDLRQFGVLLSEQSARNRVIRTGRYHVRLVVNHNKHVTDV